jgi:hypothetical protein
VGSIEQVLGRVKWCASGVTVMSPIYFISGLMTDVQVILASTQKRNSCTKEFPVKTDSSGFVYDKYNEKVVQSVCPPHI